MGPATRRGPFRLPDQVNRPPTVPAAEALLADDDIVIGVVVGGKARAYRLKAFKFIARHVVNDVINGTAVTVTYCDRDGCLRAFAADVDEPLPVRVGGFREGLLLRIGDSYFEQKTGRTADGEGLPYRTMPVSGRRGARGGRPTPTRTFTSVTRRLLREGRPPRPVHEFSKRLRSPAALRHGHGLA